MQTLYIEDLWEDCYDKYLDKLDGMDYKLPLDVIINTDGWEDTITEILIKRINRFELYSVEVYTAFSNWMKLLDRISGKAQYIDIDKDAQIMVHISAVNINIWPWGIPRGQYQRFKKEIEEKTDPHNYGILTAKERKLYLQWEDIFLCPKRVKEYYSK